MKMIEKRPTGAFEATAWTHSMKLLPMSHQKMLSAKMKPTM